MKNEKPIKKLSLERDTIRSLTPSELDGVAGGTVAISLVTGPAVSIAAVSLSVVASLHKLTEMMAE
jgi:hypothetical protein